MTNPYKAGSRKAEVYDTFLAAGGGDKGLTKATALAKKLGLAGGTVKSWASAWLKGKTKPDASPIKREKLEETKPAADDGPWFRHDSIIKANRDMQTICKRNGLRPHAFHILEQEGKFAVVPSTKYAKGEYPTFSKGDIVYDAFVINGKAKVIDPGPQQSMIKYLADAPKGLQRPKETAIPNRYLIKLVEEKKSKPKRERL